MEKLKILKNIMSKLGLASFNLSLTYGLGVEGEQVKKKHIRILNYRFLLKNSSFDLI